LKRGEVVLKWDYENMGVKERPFNTGKVITDNNMYVDIDVEQFDHYSEIKPLDIQPAILSDNPDMMKFEKEKMLAITGNENTYLDYIGMMIHRMEEKLNTPLRF
jgi:hypothetical protein